MSSKSESFAKSIGPLYPVLVDAKGKVIDGFHRKRWDPKWPERKLSWVKTIKQRVLVRIEANHRRREVSIDERRKDFRELAEIVVHEGFPIRKVSDELSRLTGYSQRHIQRLLPNKYKQEYVKSDMMSFSLENDLQITNLWTFNKCDDRFGSDFPGRVAGQIVANLLYYYTNEAEIILDPFAGSGTTIDVCQAMNRKCLAFDLHPIRDDIKENDASRGFPIGTESVDFIFLDPPYWRQKEGVYSDSPQDLANMEIDDFFNAMRKVATECKRALKPNKNVGLLIAGENRDNKFLDLAYLCYEIFDDAELSPVERVIINFGPEGGYQESYTPIWFARAKKYKFMLRAYRDLIIFRK